MKLFRHILTEEYPFLLACPALLWQFIFLYLPLLALLFFSCIDVNPSTGNLFFTTFYYAKIFKTIYFKIIINSFILALITALLCFIIAYPVAFFLAMKVRKKLRTFLLFLLILPSWTSLIIQIYAWFFLLEKNGILSQTLYRLGLISPSIHLLNNYFSILVGMVSCFLPFMILPIYAVLEKMDKQLLEASADLGADRYETFKRIIFPISLPGVYTGFLLVFIPSFGEFAIPSLLGGAKHVFWGNIIVDKFLIACDWRSGSALTMIGIILPIIVIAVMYSTARIVKIIRLIRSRPIPVEQTNIYKDQLE
jgi:spermidine/putrescine transport system permease protein